MTRDGERRAVSGPAGIRAPTANLDSVSGASTFQQVLRLAIKVAYGCGSAPGFDRLPLKKSLKLNAIETTSQRPHASPASCSPGAGTEAGLAASALVPRHFAIQRMT